ncbi:MAG: HAD family hydrolase [bacterium]|nr:HAD family hydrolase [bacterium]
MSDSRILILFDIDGTLVWTRGAGRAAMLDALDRMFSHDAALAERLRQRCQTHSFGGKTDWLTLVELLRDEGYSPQSVGALMADFNQVMGASIDRLIGGFDVQPCTGGRETVAALKAREDVRLALVTGNVSRSAPVKLRAAGYAPADFPVGAFGDDAMDRDHLPPLAFERACAHYACSFAPHNVIVVGDTLADIQCARAAGFRAVAVCTGFEARDVLLAAAPDALIDDLHGLAAVLPGA